VRVCACPLCIETVCECEHNNPDSLDVRRFPSVVLAVAPAVDHGRSIFSVGSLVMSWP